MQRTPKHLYAVESYYLVNMFEENQKVLDLGHALVVHREAEPNGNESVHVCFSSEILFVQFIARHRFVTRPISKQVGASLRNSFSKTSSVYCLQGPKVLEALSAFCQQVTQGLKRVEISFLY